MAPTVWAYIDGFNLYNAQIKGTPYKWLDLAKMCDLLCPRDTVANVKYFTAEVVPRVTDPDQPARQQRYWRALRTLGRVEIIEGHFTSFPRLMPLNRSVENLEAAARQGQNVTGRRPSMVTVLRCEEKGSDVNLATHLVHDAHCGRFQAALVVSNDSDLAEAMRIVRCELKLPVGLCPPLGEDRRGNPQKPSGKLTQQASFHRRLSQRILAASVLPPVLTDCDGPFSKPPSW